MADEKLIEYYIKHADERFDKLEAKVDKLISFRAMLFGAAGVISALVSFVVGIFFK